MTLRDVRVAEPWRVVVMPDSQVCAAHFPHILEKQCAWIAENLEALSIRLVAHVGDMTDDNSEGQWRGVRRALEPLVGRVPLALAPGNHDYGERGLGHSRDTGLVRTLRAEELGPSLIATFDGSLTNSVTLVGDWIALALELAPRDEVLAWAGAMLDAHRERRALVVTHAHLYEDGARYDWRSFPEQHWSVRWYRASEPAINDAAVLWERVLSRHANVCAVVSGHILGAGVARAESRGAHGNVVHEMVANYQHEGSGGDGFLRILEIHDDVEPARIEVRTYSPWLDAEKRDPANRFSLKLERPANRSAGR